MTKKFIKIDGDPYLYENAFTNDKGDIIEYTKLCVNLKIGDKVCRLSKTLHGFETEYIKDLISADNAFSEDD